MADYTPAKRECKILNPAQVLRIGCAGWTIPREFSARFPARGTHLERYSQVLTCTEINSCFYRPHKPETWTRWKESVPHDFLFSVKAPKSITHVAKLDCSREALTAFLDQVSFLAEKLGPILFQLPPSLKFDEAAARKFLSMLRETCAGEIIWEPRHESWFESGADELLKTFRIARAAADPACVPDGHHPGGWQGLHYYRLHGSPRRYYSSYPPEFLRNMAARIVNTESNGAVPTWCIFDNTALGASMSNALELTQIWDDLSLSPIKTPQTGP